MAIASRAVSAAELLTAYRPDRSFLFASPRGTLLAEGTYFAVPPSARPRGLADLPQRVAAVLDVAIAAGHDDPVVVGAIPFDHDVPAALAVPLSVRRAEPVSAGTAEVVDQPTFDVHAEPSPQRFAAAVDHAVRRMRAGEFEKVVLARSLRLTADRPVNVPPLVAALARRDPGGYTFATTLGAGRTLFGASPELLVSRHGRLFTANPIAGSAPRSADAAEDERRGQALLRSAKDRHEHGVVVDAVATALRPLASALHVPSEPVLIRTATMWHLSTTVTGEVAGPDVSALALATALHPTPAVCGSPTDAARAAIAQLETIDRGFYTGLVGWGDADGDGEWVVTIRCGVTEGHELRLYAGAGIVADSDPEAELAETSAKFRTMLTGLGM